MIKPTPELFNEWCVKATVARLNNDKPGVYEMTLAELAAAWGASQAQQTTVEEPELPGTGIERRRVRYSWGECFAYRDPECVPFTGSGVELISKAEPLYTATQMYDHFAAKVREAMAQQWQPIDSAPKDGTVFLGQLPDSDVSHAVRWEKDSWVISWDGYRLEGLDAPTHWMPLPAPPAMQGGQQ